MEHKQTKFYEQTAFDFANISNQSERLTAIINANAEIANDKLLYHNSLEKAERDLMKNPITNEKAFARFGLILGTFPPMVIFGSFIYGKVLRQPINSANEVIGIVAFLIFINIICAVVGYYSGKHIISKLVEKTETLTWSKMILLSPLFGVLWGVITGGISGVFIFVIGLFFGAIIASIVGSIALTTFTVFHRLLKRGDSIEQKHFLPLAFGITATICAFILGLMKF
jgi:hypothetical protein